MKKILLNLDKEEKLRIMELHNKTKIKEWKFIFEQLTGETKNFEIDLTGWKSNLQNVLNTFNTTTSAKDYFGYNPELFVGTSVEPNKIIFVSNPYMQDLFGTRRPYGLVGVNFGTGEYKHGSVGNSMLYDIKSSDDIAGVLLNSSKMRDRAWNPNDKMRENVLTAARSTAPQIDAAFKDLLNKIKGQKNLTVDRGEGNQFILKTTSIT